MDNKAYERDFWIKLSQKWAYKVDYKIEDVLKIINPKKEKEVEEIKEFDPFNLDEI